jgi:hypothetical protein
MLICLAAGLCSGGPAAADEAAPAPPSAAAKAGAESPAPARPVVIYTKDRPPATPKLEDLPLKEGVSQYGITWTFGKPARVGQFVNGDYYVVGPVTVKTIDPKPLWGDEVKDVVHKQDVKENDYPGQWARNGSTLNHTFDKKNFKGYGGAGFDSRIPGHRYNPDLFARLPIEMGPGDALISTISRPTSELTDFGGQHVDPLRVAAVLTCLGAPQPPDAFRPSYCDTKNSHVYLARNLRRELLLSVAPTPGCPAAPGKYAAAFQKPWIDVVEFGFAAPMDNLPHYGQNICDKVGEASLCLLMDYKPEDKEPLLINMVQVGIDFWGLARAGMTWRCWGGHSSGRKALLLLTSLMFADQDMQRPYKACPKVQFGEDDQTAMCPFEYHGQTYQRGWTGAKAIFVGHSLEKNGGGAKGDPGWGPVDLVPPSQWPLKRPGGLPASEGYRRSNTSNSWIGEALAFRMMHAEKLWDHDAFFAYVDRWMTEDDTPFVEEMKKAGAQDYTKAKFGSFGRQGYVYSARFVKEMWNKYRNNLPPAADGHKDPPAEVTWK